MISLSIAEMAKAVNGSLLNCDNDNLLISAVSTDTRSIAAGGLFVALSGE